MIYLSIIILCESVLMYLTSFLYPAIWTYFIPFLSIISTFSGFVWIRHYKLISNQFKKNKPDIFDENEYLAITACPSITFSRAQYGFRTLDVSALSGWVQILLIFNLILSIYKIDIFSIVLTIILLYFAFFTYSTEIPGSNPVEDLTRIYFALGKSPKEARYMATTDEERYVKLIDKLRQYIMNTNKSKSQVKK